MKSSKIIATFAIATVLALLATPPLALATTRVALLPGTAVLSISAGNLQQEFDAFCNSSCTITWILILSESGVGSINNTSGPTTTFTAGGTPGTAHLIASDGQGHSAVATITVQQ